MSAPVLEARGLSFRLGARQVMRDVSLALNPGDCAALLGANGAGKTTLLRALLGFVRPHQGEVRLDGRPLAAHGRRAIARRIAYVPQAHAPSFPYTVREIVAMARAPASGWGPVRTAKDEAAISDALERLGLTAFAERSYAGLSGGERQAVLVARALAQEAQILLMDEPSASLDLGQQARLMALLGQLAAEGRAILMSTHQPELALRGFNRAVLLHGGEVLGDGPPRAVLTAETLSRLYAVEVRLVEADAEVFLSATAVRSGDNGAPSAI
jgi:iron complex transport system ATP-binding protein